MNLVRAKTRTATLLCSGALLLAGRGQAETSPSASENPYEGERTWEDAPPPQDESGVSTRDGSTPDAVPPGAVPPGAVQEAAAPPSATPKAALPADPPGNFTVQDMRPGDGAPQDGAADAAPRATPHAGAPRAGAPSSTGAVVFAEHPAGVAHGAEASSGQGGGEGAAEPAASGPSAHRVTAIALTGLSFVGAGVGVSAAIHSTSLHRLARTECDPVCSGAAESYDRRARNAATVAQVAFAVGLVSLGGAAYLWLTEPSAERARGDAASAAGGWRFDVAAAPGGGSAWLAGSF